MSAYLETLQGKPDTTNDLDINQGLQRLDLQLPIISASYIENFRMVKGYCRLISVKEVQNGVSIHEPVLGEKPATFPKKVLEWTKAVKDAGLTDDATIAKKALQLRDWALAGSVASRAALFDMITLQSHVIQTSYPKTST